MITKSQAVALGLGQGSKYIYSPFYRNKNGDFTNCRVNGKCKIWKTRPMEFRLPISIGYRDHGYITERNADEWYLTPEEANRNDKQALYRHRVREEANGRTE